MTTDLPFEYAPSTAFLSHDEMLAMSDAEWEAREKLRWERSVQAIVARSGAIRRDVSTPTTPRSSDRRVTLPSAPRGLPRRKVLSTEERIDLAGITIANVVDLKGSSMRAEMRCRERELLAEGGRVAECMLASMRQWAGGAPAATPLTEPLTDAQMAEAMVARADAHLALADEADGLVRVSADAVAAGIMADLGIDCNEDGWARGYQLGYGDAMRRRDYVALTPMAIRMGVVAMGPFDGGVPVNGAHYGAYDAADVVTISLEVLWRLLCSYRRGSLSPRGWVRKWLFHRLENVRHALDAENDMLFCAEPFGDQTISVPSAADDASETLLRQSLIDVLGDTHGRLAWLVLMDGYTLPEAAPLAGMTVRQATSVWHDRADRNRPGILSRLRAAMIAEEI